MKSKYNINDSVEHPITKNKLMVNDLELIDNQYVYYFDNFLCFPEKDLKPYGFTMLKCIVEGTGIYSKESMDTYCNNALRFADDFLKSEDL